jgi:hypothetical protein
MAGKYQLWPTWTVSVVQSGRGKGPIAYFIWSFAHQSFYQEILAHWNFNFSKLPFYFFDEIVIVFFSGLNLTCILLVKRKYQKIILKSIFGNYKSIIKWFKFDQILIRFLHFQPVLLDYLSFRSREHGTIECSRSREPGTLSGLLRAKILDCIGVRGPETVTGHFFLPCPALLPWVALPWTALILIQKFSFVLPCPQGRTFQGRAPW